MKNFFLNYLSQALNTYLRLDPESKQRLQKLNGQTITIELLPLHFIFQCLFTGEGITLLSDAATPAQAKICGTPLQMLGAILTRENRNHFFADDLTITGNAEAAQQVVALFDELHIDWEEFLSHLIGDVSAHHAGRFINKVSDWLHHAEETLNQNINDYIHEEAQWLPAHEALQDFFTDVDTLRMDVDRIEARLKNLAAHVASTANPEDTE
jgi:ubiquinone biosynthesis protein UbiJ